MPIITIDEVKDFLSEDETTYDEVIGRLIPVVTERLRYLCNNPFTAQPLIESVFQRFSVRDYDYQRMFARDADLYILPAVMATFDASSLTVTARGENFASAGFAAGQDVFVRDSYLNDGYFEISSVSTSTLTVLSAYSFAGAIEGTHEFKDEVTGASIYFAVVEWPKGIKPVVASMIQFDYQERGNWAESEGGEGHGEYGYPTELLRMLQPYTKPAYGLYHK
jgi:hypothetical protein